MTDTLNMHRKKFFYLWAVALICLNGCGKNPKKIPLQQGDFSARNFDFSLMEDLQSETLFPPETLVSDNTAPPEIWDTSDVDVSQIDPSRKLIAFTFDDAPTRKLENLFAVFANTSADTTNFNEKASAAPDSRNT